MKFLEKCVVVLVSVYLTGCAGAGAKKPVITELKEKPYVIEVPKNLDNAENLLKGVYIHNRESVSGRAPVLDKFIVKHMQNKETSEMVSQFCSGEFYTTAREFKKSCVYYDSKVSIVENDNSYTISILPYRKRVILETNALFITLDAPNISIDKWQQYLSEQYANLTEEITSSYPTKSLKANFDRSFRKKSYRRDENQTRSDQFADSYYLPEVQGTVRTIGVKFYPYKEGSMAEVNYRLGSYYKKGKTDWVKVVSDAKKVVNDTVAK